ncbi:MAG: AAA family ATPase [Methanothrix sp.]|nr:AAA family ATPase [Methanothrix sp.]
MVIEIKKPDTSRFAKCLFFGPSGHGKTTLLGTAEDDPRTSPSLLLSYEGGTSSLVGRDIDIVDIRSWRDFNEAYALLSDPSCKYKSVGIDSVSETHIFALLTLLDGDRNRKIPDLLEQGDYGIALVQMRKFLRSFRDLPMHVFMTALAKDETDPREGLVKKPSLTGSLADEAPGIFDVVAYLGLGNDEAGDEHRFLCLHDVPKLRVKTRTPWKAEVPQMIPDPTITLLLDALQIPKGPASKK